MSKGLLKDTNTKIIAGVLVIGVGAFTGYSSFAKPTNKMEVKTELSGYKAAEEQLKGVPVQQEIKNKTKYKKVDSIEKFVVDSNSYIGADIELQGQVKVAQYINKEKPGIIEIYINVQGNLGFQRTLLIMTHIRDIRNNDIISVKGKIVESFEPLMDERKKTASIISNNIKILKQAE